MCKTCNGSANTDCLKCINEKMILDADSLCKCPSNTYYLEQKCECIDYIII